MDRHGEATHEACVHVQGMRSSAGAQEAGCKERGVETDGRQGCLARQVHPTLGMQWVADLGAELCWVKEQPAKHDCMRVYPST